ncbi:transcription initiation factor TFIID subunit 7, putative [Plasmodium sp. gorilla clade G2]|uniref:transcription initiation factor TFIID subunit 7, putative n=1 Tax=Plasmodium sp. gorilla clade G2 TaxID=880535 RepID=UPI000D21A93B|nr:transcription initiation factor TFIID subunit 7, putative [Plasmodium sp. gorilla clade G2]SOV14463.1 transcription initiation factor TFIID subunit 7, putative [Plasmodium sp. gorilla clade G2]
MEKNKKESTIKISLNINTKLNDTYLDEQNDIINEVPIKNNNKEIIHSLNLIENIRHGTFDYKDLKEVYFMNDNDLFDMLNDKKASEEKGKGNKEDAHNNNNNNIDNKICNNDKVSDKNKNSSNNNNDINIENEGDKNYNFNINNETNIFVVDNDVDKVCIIRFPFSVSKDIKKYLLQKNLDIVIQPTTLLNSRFFLIHFKNINKKFHGILLELSTHIEIHKTLDRNNLYKANDVSQMIYVYEHSTNSKELLKKFINNNFELCTGISNKLNHFNFQNHTKLFKYHDIFFAEKLIYEYLNTPFYDYYDLYVKTFNEMHNHIIMEKQNNNKQNEIVDETTDLATILGSLDNSYNIMNIIEKQDGDIDFEALLSYDIEKDNYESDVSDLLLGGTYYLQKK